MVNYDKEFSAFTTRYRGLRNVLYNKISLSPPYDPEKDKTRPPTLIECVAIWDTGASISSITKTTAQKIGLQPSGKAEVSNTSGKQIRDTYLVNIYLPNEVALSYVRIVECDSLVGNFEFLVGMDIIGKGDFSVTNVGGKTTMSYRIPSVEEVDYVEEARIIKEKRKVSNKIELEKEKREVNLSTQKSKKIEERRKKEKQRRKMRKRNRKRK